MKLKPGDILELDVDERGVIYVQYLGKHQERIWKVGRGYSITEQTFSKLGVGCATTLVGLLEGRSWLLDDRRELPEANRWLCDERPGASGSRSVVMRGSLRVER